MRVKLGIHLSTFTREWNDDIFEHMGTVESLGYDGVEIPLISPFGFDVAKGGRSLKAHKLQATCGTGLGVNTDITSPDRDTRNRGQKHLEKCLEICHSLESGMLAGVLYAPWGVQSHRSTIGDGARHSIDILESVARKGESYGVALGLELLNRYESSMLNTVEDGLELLSESNQSNLGLHFDTYHSHIEEMCMVSALKKASPKLKHIHFCENHRGIPGTGSIPWSRVAVALKEMNYSGWVVLECFTQSECGIGKDVSIWRGLSESPNVVAQKGYEFMDNLLRGEE